MHVQVHYSNLENSPWTNEFIERRVNKLNKYLTQSSNIQVNVRYENRMYSTTLAIHNPHHDYAFIAQGENLYESFSAAIAKATRILGEQKRRVKDRIHSKFYKIKQDFQLVDESPEQEMTS